MVVIYCYFKICRNKCNWYKPFCWSIWSRQIPSLGCRLGGNYCSEVVAAPLKKRNFLPPLDNKSHTIEMIISGKHLLEICKIGVGQKPEITYRDGLLILSVSFSYAFLLWTGSSTLEPDDLVEWHERKTLFLIIIIIMMQIRNTWMVSFGMLFTTLFWSLFLFMFDPQA